MTSNLALSAASCTVMAALLGWAPVAHAQDGGRGGGGGRGAGPAALGGVTVNGAPQAFRSSIDTRAYSIAEDLLTTSGSIADALKNVPSLDVDLQGNVSLRGDSNVTILIDGRPSGMFRGEGRGDALLQMPAEQVERVEVMTNPSAAYSPEGGGGTINLITKKGRGAGTSGSLRANFGAEARYNFGLSGAYNTKTLSLAGDIGGRRNRTKNASVDERTQIGSTGVETKRGQTSTSIGANESRNLRGSADYDLSAVTRLSAELRFSDSDSKGRTFDHYRNFSAAGLLAGMSDRIGQTTGERSDLDASLGWRRKFGDGHELVLDLSSDRELDERTRDYVTLARLPAGSDLFEHFNARTEERETRLRADYTRPMGGEATLKTGYDLRIEKNLYDNLGLRGGAVTSTAIVPSLTNSFRYGQTIQAAYATFERPFGDLTVQGGLRAEHVEVRINQITSAIKETNSYTRLYPSLHLGYRLSDDQTLTASYSHRVRRPRPDDLNPFRVYQDPFNFRMGNPRLKPQETHSVEAGYQLRREGAYYLATAFYRQNYKGVTEVVRDLGGGVLLTTRENLSKSRSGGLELVANGKLAANKLSYNINGSAFWNEIDASALGFTQPRSAYAVSGRANITWQVTPKDIVQLNGFAAGKRLTAQGYNAPFGMVNLGYRHKFSDRLSGVVTVQDVLKTSRNRLVIDTPLLKQEVTRRQNQQAVFVGFTYSFGAAPKRGREDGFEFEGGGEAADAP